MEVTESDPGSGLGARLRRAREQRGLSVEECAERLYLPGNVIEALESEQFGALGASVYVRGHLRRYAGLLELDAAGLDQLMLQRLSGAPDLATIQTHRIGNSSSSRRRLGVMPVAIVAVLLALVVLAWWSVRHGDDRAVPASEPVPIPVTPSSAVPPTGGSPGASVAPDTNGASATPAALADPPDAAARSGAASSSSRSPAGATGPAPSAQAAPAAQTAPASPQAAVAAHPAERGPLVIASGGPAVRPRAQSPQSLPAAAAAPSAAAAPRKRPEPPKAAEPAVPPPPRETQRDYMNFDF